LTEKKPIIHLLSNGLRLVYLHADSPVSHFGLTLLSGSRYEKNNEMGLAHFLEHCLFKGTRKRKSFHILSRLDSVGGELNAYTAKEELCIYASYSKEYTARAIELIADISINSNFPDKEIEKEKEIILDEINSYLDNPSDKIFDDFEELLFSNHELGNNILGNKKSVKSFNKEHLCNYVKRLFTASNGVISFVGDLPFKKVKKICEKNFGDFPSHNNEIEVNSFKNYQPFNVIKKEANYQSHLVIGGIAPGYTNKEKVCISLLINLLGGPALNSRLVLTIREKYGYAYNIEANYTPYLDIGFWTIYLGCDQKFLKKSIEIINRELKKLCLNELSNSQLKNAKTQMKGHIALNMDSNSGMMLGLGKSLLIFNKIDNINEIHEQIDRIKADELLTVANKYLHPDKSSSLIFDLK